MRTSVYKFTPQTWQKGVNPPKNGHPVSQEYENTSTKFRTTGRSIKYSTNHTIPRTKNYSIFGNQDEKFDRFIEHGEIFTKKAENTDFGRQRTRIRPQTAGVAGRIVEEEKSPEPTLAQFNDGRTRLDKFGYVPMSTSDTGDHFINMFLRTKNKYDSVQKMTENMLKTKKELKTIKPEVGITSNELQSGLEVNLQPIVNPIVPETLNELEYGLEKNSKHLVNENTIGGTDNIPTNYNCNFILDPRYLTHEEKQSSSLRLNSGVQNELAQKEGKYGQKKRNLSPQTLKNMHLRQNKQSTDSKISDFLNTNFRAVSGAVKISKENRGKSKVARKILEKDLLAQDIQKREVVKKPHQQKLQGLKNKHSRLKNFEKSRNSKAVQMFKKTKGKIMNLKKLTKIVDLADQEEHADQEEVRQNELRKEFKTQFQSNMVKYGLGFKSKKAAKRAQEVALMNENHDFKQVEGSSIEEEYNFQTNYLEESENDLKKSMAQRTETTRLEAENALEDSFESLNVSFSILKSVFNMYRVSIYRMKEPMNLFCLKHLAKKFTSMEQKFPTMNQQNLLK